MKIKALLITVCLLLCAICALSCTDTDIDDANGIGADNTNNSEVTTDDTLTQAHTHTPSSAVKENVTEADCTNGGSYDEVVYCSECGDELSREIKSTEPIGHQYENEICSVCGAPKVSEGLKFKSNGNGTCTLSGIGSCEDTDVIVPTVSPNGDTVSGISSTAFYNCKALSSIRIPDTVTSIGNNAFSGCVNLQEIVLPAGLKSFGVGVFSGCGSLKYNKLDGLCYLGSRQNSYLVLCEAEDKTKSSYEISADTVFVSEYAFASCEKLTGITVPDSVIGIGDSAFKLCTSLVSVTLPKDLTAIEESLFEGCTLLESVNIPAGVRSIGASAFEVCSSLNSIELPSGISLVAERTFRNCKNLKNVTIPSGVTALGEMSFEGCESIESIVIPSNLRTIGVNSFRYCSSLKSVRFEKTNGWQRLEAPTLNAGDVLDVSDPEFNAVNLSFRWPEFTWKRF